MGIFLILFGLAATAVVADVVVENPMSTAPDQEVALFGGTLRLSTPEMVLGAAVLGALAVLLVILGLGMLRGSWGRRRALKQRVAELERENAEVLSGTHPAATVRMAEPRSTIHQPS